MLSTGPTPVETESNTQYISISWAYIQIPANRKIKLFQDREKTVCVVNKTILFALLKNLIDDISYSH